MEHHNSGAIGGGKLGGFNAGRMSSAHFRMSSPLGSPSSSSGATLLTIPPGICPTLLLDSPIMLSNSQLLSPTTGTFSLPPLFMDDGFIGGSITADGGNFDEHVGGGGYYSGSTFSFNPPDDNNNSSQMSSLVDLEVAADQGTAGADHLMDYEYQAVDDFLSPEAAAEKSKISSLTGDSSIVSSEAEEEEVEEEDEDKVVVGEDIKPRRKEFIPEDDASMEVEEGSGDVKGRVYNKKNSNTSLLGGMSSNKTGEDGYNWRKYGQKQVKGSEYPRSYYKCTHPNCQMKKKVERSHDGHITEIIYKGAHHHPKPNPSRRGGVGAAAASFPFTDTTLGQDIKGDGCLWRNNVQLVVGGGGGGSNGIVKQESFENSNSVITDLSDPQDGKSANYQLESAHTPELSSTLASHGDEDGATQGEEADNDLETDSKRRRSDNESSNVGSRAVREPRVVIQIETEIDILDDGYRWRKYGQKVVKGNPNPRSYYKCTSAGCGVRKHVERASHDLKCVLTTYEGKHNHELPAARSSGNLAAAPSSSAQAQAHNNNNNNNCQASSAAAAMPIAIPKPEVLQEDLFERKPELSSSEFLRSSLFAHLGNNDMKKIIGGGASMYPTMPFRSSLIPCFGVKSRGIPPPPMVVPDLPPVSLPFKYTTQAPPPPKIPGINGLVDYTSSIGKTTGLVPSFMTSTQQQQQQQQEMSWFLTPKQELKDDHFYDAFVDPTPPPPSASSMFPQAIATYPS